MLNQFSRTQLLLGEEGMKKLAGARVAVFGIGGVGGYVCEALVRSGVGAFDLIDDDESEPPDHSNAKNSGKIQDGCYERAYAGNQSGREGGDT